MARCCPCIRPDVGADHKELVGIQGFARADDDVPPARLLFSLVLACRMGVSGEGVADQDGVALFLIQPAIGLIGDHGAGSRSPFSRLSHREFDTHCVSTRPTDSLFIHRLGQRLIEIGDYVLDVLDADGYANEVGCDSCGFLLRGRQLLVCGRCGMDDQALGVADVCQMREQLHGLDELLGRRRPPLMPNPRMALYLPFRYFTARAWLGCSSRPG